MFATAGALASCRGRTRCYGIDPGRQLTDVTPDLTNMRLRMRTRHAVARRLPVVMVAGAGVVVLATVIGIRHAGPRHTPGDRLTSALGAPAPRAPLVRRPSHTVTVRLGHDGYTVTVPRAGAVTLAADGSHEPWSRFANGVARSTRFGREAITVQRSRTEEFLTVSKRQGARTWRWNLRALGLRPTPDRDGGGFVFRTQHAQSPLRLAPVRILDQQGRVVTPNGVHWLLRRAHDRSWRLELRLDDAKLPLPYVIDPAIDYPSPLYLSSSASSAAGSWRLLTTAPSGANTLTRTIPAANATGYYLFKPGAQNTATGTPSGTPTGTGFVQDIAGGTGFPAGTWSFSIKTQIPSTNLVAGTARLAVGMWTGTINNHGAFKAKQTIFAPTDDPAGQNIRSATSRTTTVAFSVPAFSLASTDRLYVEIWRKQVGGINSTSTSDREVDLVVNDGGSQIAHPPTDDTPPANAFSVANPTGGVYFTNPGGATGTLYYRGSAVGSFQLQDAATDSGSGVKQVGYPAVTAAGWIHSANTVTTGPTYPSSKYSWSAGSTSSPGAQAIAAQDNALNSSTGSPVTFTNDTTAPTVTMGALPTVIVSGQTLTASASDTGSGVASVAYYYCGPSPCTPNTLIGSSSTGPSYSFTWTTQPPDATYDLLARATDNTGSQADSAKQTVKIQNAAPDTTITIQPPDPSNDPAPTFWFSSTDPAATFQCKLDTAAFTVCTSPTTLNALADGTHSFSVRSISSAGKVDPTPATWSWTVDTAAPDTSITSEPNDPTSSAAASLSFTSTETGSSFQCQLDANTYAACTSPSTITGLLDGSHTFSVRATDAAGNTDGTPATFTWTVDTGPPDTTITSQPANPSTATSADFSFGSSEAGSTFQCQLDSGSYVACSSPTNLNGLADGSHTFSVEATDAAGNVDPTPASSTWTVDTTPPDTTITEQPTDPSTTPSATFSFTSTEAGSSFQCQIDGASYTACSSPQAYSGLANGTHSFAVTAVDAAGNVDATPATYSWTVNATVVPVDEVHYTFTGLTSVAFDWRGTANDIRYGPTSSYGNTVLGYTPTPLPYSSAGPFNQADITGLTPGASYHYSIGGGPDHTFTTAPTGTYTFDVMGDIGSSIASSKAKTTQAEIASDAPAFVLDGRRPHLWQHRRARPPSTTLQRRDGVEPAAAYMPVWGNHEWDSAGRRPAQLQGPLRAPAPPNPPGLAEPRLLRRGLGLVRRRDGPLHRLPRAVYEQHVDGVATAGGSPSWPPHRPTRTSLTSSRSDTGPPTPPGYHPGDPAIASASSTDSATAIRSTCSTSTVTPTTTSVSSRSTA